MNDSSQNKTGAFTSRESIRAEIRRSGTLVAVVLIIVLALTLAVALTGFRATRAEADGAERLWHSYLAQASTLRLTFSAGRRARALEVISNAAAFHPNPALRTEAAASLALTDLAQVGAMRPLRPGSDQMEMDAALEKFAYGDAQGIAYIGKLDNGSNLMTLDDRSFGSGFSLPVRSVSFSPNGKFLGVRHQNGALALWDLERREPILQAGANRTNGVLTGASWSADSRIFYFSDPDRERQVTRFDVATRERIASGVVAGARIFRFRPGANELALVVNTNVDLLSHPAGELLREFPHPTRVYSVAWSPDGAQLAVSCEDGDVYLWDVARASKRLLRGHSELCVRMAFSPDGRRLFTGSRDGTTRLWDVGPARLVLQAEDGVGHGFSPDGERLGFFKFAPSLGVWRLEESDCFNTLYCPADDGALTGVDLSADGRWCVAVQETGFRLWDLSANQLEQFFPVADLVSVRLAPDSKSIFVCRSNAFERWPLIESAEEKIQFAPAQNILLPGGAGARQIALALDGRSAAVELTDNRFCVIDLAGQREPVIFSERWRGLNAKGAGSSTGPGRFAISPDGRWVFTGYWFGARDRPQVWDVQTGKAILQPDMGTALAVFSADGKWLGLSGLGDFQIYSTTNWALKKTIKRDEISFTHGALAFTGSSGEVAYTRTRQQLRLRSALGDETFLDLLPPAVQSIGTLRVSLDGRVLLAGGVGNEIHLWRLDRLHAALATMNLDWGGNQRQPGQANPQSPWTGVRAFLIFAGLGFFVIALLSLFALRHHRAAIERFFAAENQAADRNRALEAAKVELMHSQKMQALGTLAAGIAHDFNNLLSVIRMANKLMRRRAADDPRLQQNAEEIEQAVLRGKGVVSSMLGYARSESAEEGPTDLCAAVENTVGLLTREFLSGITLKLDLDRNSPRARTSRAHIEQILLNLVVNASEAMQGKGELKISVIPLANLPEGNFILRPTSASGFVEVTVVDSGPGIPAEVRDRLFEPFFTTKRGGAKPGTGLGLSLVYSLAQQDELGLAVESEPGRGAAFKIFVPV